MRRRSRSAAAVSRSTSALLLVVLAAGCGGSSTGAGTSTTAATATTAATTAGPQSALGTLLPQRIQDAGALRVATAGGTSSLDRALARTTGAAFGTAVRFVPTSDAVAAVATGRADVGWASLPDTASKRRGVTYVDYLRGANGGLLGVAVKSGDAQLVAALKAALQHLRDDGTYGRVLAKNDATTRGVTDFGTDGG